MDETEFVQVIPSHFKQNVFPIDLLNRQNDETAAFASLRTIIENEQFLSVSVAVPVACGYEAGGNPNIQDLCQFPHLLIGGDAGSGKSCFLHSLLLSFFFSNTPAELKLFLVDTKREFELYNSIPYLTVPIITCGEKAIVALKWLLGEMLHRYAEMGELKVKDFDSYRNAIEKLGRKNVPKIVFVVDEMNDIMKADSLNAENLICRIAQLGRWVGIHLILSSQHVTPEVFTKTIRDNFRARAAFYMGSPRSSRIIMDCDDALTLRHPGEMVLLRNLTNSSIRMKVPYVTACEIHSVTAYLRKKYGINYDEDIANSIFKS